MFVFTCEIRKISRKWSSWGVSIAPYHSALCCSELALEVEAVAIEGDFYFLFCIWADRLWPEYTSELPVSFRSTTSAFCTCLVLGHLWNKVHARSLVFRQTSSPHWSCTPEDRLASAMNSNSNKTQIGVLIYLASLEF